MPLSWLAAEAAAAPLLPAALLNAVPPPLMRACAPALHTSLLLKVLEVVAGSRGIADREGLAETLHANADRMFFGQRRGT